MRRLFTALALVASLGFAVPGSAAQEDARLDELFERLKITGDPVEGRGLTSEIWSIWLWSDDESVDRLMRKGIVAMAERNFETALILFNAIVEEAPDFAEGWNKRATVHYLMGNYPASVSDVERTLALEPRHFGALSGLGLINMALGRDEVALKAFEAALEVNPHLPGPKANIEDIKRRLEGEAL